MQRFSLRVSHWNAQTFLFTAKDTRSFWQKKLVLANDLPSFFIIKSRKYFFCHSSELQVRAVYSSEANSKWFVILLVTHYIELNTMTANIQEVVRNTRWHYLHMSQALNHFTCYIAHVSLPLGREIFIDKKRDQVKTNDHVLIIRK